MRRFTLAGPAALLLIAMAACAGGSDGETHEVTLEDFAFSPTELSIAVGDTVTFTNADDTAHTATHGENGEAVADPAFDIDLPATDSDGEYRFTAPGVYSVTCEIHHDMRLVITVE